MFRNTTGTEDLQEVSLHLKEKLSTVSIECYILDIKQGEIEITYS